MSTSEGRSPYRWVIEALLLLALISQTLTWLAPAPLLHPIINDLGIDLGNAGLIISIIALCIAIFSLAGAVVAERLGALRSLIIGLWMLAIGGVLSGYAPNFILLLGCRVLEGIGFGLLIAPPATLVMQWFSESEWPYMNTLNAVAPFLGLTAAFAVTGPVYLMLGKNWRSVLLVYGLFVAAIAILWTVLGRTHSSQAHGAGHTAEAGVMGEVLAMRNIRVIAVGLFSGMWVFQLYSAFLPEFFETVRGMSLEHAGGLTALIPFTGVFAAAGAGVLTGWIGLRRPFMYPMQVLFAVGCLGAVSFTSVGAIRVSLILIGIGSSALLPTLFTLVMELPGMTPTKAGTGLGVIWAAGYAGAFLSPVICGAIAARVGLATVMQGSLVFALVAIGAFYRVPETGPGRATSGAEVAEPGISPEVR
jgi:cyanate permease